MGETSAGLHGIVAGDVVELIAFNGSVVSLAVSSVVADSVVRGTEILVDLDAARRLGMSRDTYVIGWNVDRGAFQAGYLAGPLANRRETKVRRSWDAPDPDSTLSTARVKQQLGIPAYVVRGDGSVGIDDGWVAANLPGERLLLNESIRIRARCHNGINDALRAALAEIAASGRAAAVNVTNTNRYGGCFQARFNRIAGDIGILSRHTWGLALGRCSTAMWFAPSGVTGSLGAAPSPDPTACTSNGWGSHAINLSTPRSTVRTSSPLHRRPIRPTTRWTLIRVVTAAARCRRPHSRASRSRCSTFPMRPSGPFGSLRACHIAS